MNIKNKTVIITLVMTLISFSFVFAQVTYTTSCLGEASSSVLYEQAPISADYARILASDIDRLSEEAESIETNLEAMRDLQSSAQSDEEREVRNVDMLIEEARLKELQDEQQRLEAELKRQRTEAERLRTEALRERLSTAAGALGVFNEAYNNLKWANYYIDKWDSMEAWQSKVDETFTRLYLGIEPITSHLCSLWTVTTDSTSNIAFGEDGTASAHVEGVVVETREDPVNGVPVVVFQHRVTFSVSSSVLINPKEAATIFVNLYTGNTKMNELGSYKLGEGVSEIGAQGESTLVAPSGKNYDLVCLRFTEMWKYKGDFRTFIRKCPDKEGDCLCNRFGASGNTLPGGSWAVPGE
ncbi:TPA: hypothetical protein HA219_01605 [Candidatus Woesearchaeota archaeon]|nr:hypothetical protein [Candidatus Woesearchaeota archaeon]